MLNAYICDYEESEVFAAESAEQAAQLYRDMNDREPDDGFPQELTAVALDKVYPVFDEDERPIEGATTTIRQMLAEHGNEPGWLCGSNW